MSVDTFKGWTGHPFTLYVDDIQEWYIALCYVLKLMISRGWPFFTILDDTFKGWTPFYTYVDDIQGWDPLCYVLKSA